MKPYLTWEEKEKVIQATRIQAEEFDRIQKQNDLQNSHPENEIKSGPRYPLSIKRMEALKLEVKQCKILFIIRTILLIGIDILLLKFVFEIGFLFTILLVGLIPIMYYFLIWHPRFDYKDEVEYKKFWESFHGTYYEDIPEEERKIEFNFKEDSKIEYNIFKDL